jgi:hypothetical protein
MKQTLMEITTGNFGNGNTDENPKVVITGRKNLSIQSMEIVLCTPSVMLSFNGIAVSLSDILTCIEPFRVCAE